MILLDILINDCMTTNELRLSKCVRVRHIIF